MQCDVIILAAGKGTRLKSALPKVLHPLFDKPLLKHVLDSLCNMATCLLPDDQGALTIGRVVVVVGHGRAQVGEALAAWAREYPFSLETVVQDPQNGTGHAVLQAEPLLGSAGTVLVLSGDVPLLRPESLWALVQQHATRQQAITVMSTTLDNPTGYGRLLTPAEDAARLLGIVEEKDASPEQRAIGLVNGGVYTLQWPQVLPLLHQLQPNNAQGELYLTDTVGLALSQGLSVGHVPLLDSAELHGVNARADLSLCHAELNARTLARWQAEGVTIIDPASTWIGPDVMIGSDTTVYPNCWLSGQISIGHGNTIGPGTTLKGSVVTGDGTTIRQSWVEDSVLGHRVSIGPFAHLRGHSVIGNAVRIGNFVEVKHTHIADNTNAAHLSYLGDARLGRDVNIGAGTITANYDPIRQAKNLTELRDGVKVGCNAVLVAPLTVHENAVVAAGSVITDDVPAGDLAIARPRQSTITGWVDKTQAALAEPTPVTP